MNLQRAAAWAIAALASVPAFAQTIHAVSPHAGGSSSSVRDTNGDGGVDFDFDDVATFFAAWENGGC